MLFRCSLYFLSSVYRYVCIWRERAWLNLVYIYSIFHTVNNCKCMALLYLSHQNKLAEILYDSTRVSFTYDETAGVLKTVNLQSEGFICSIRYRQIGPLVDRQIFRFSEDGMVNARFDYTYDNSFRVTSMQAVINETPLPIDLYQFDDISGKVEQFGKFGVIYYDINQVSQEC